MLSGQDGVVSEGSPPREWADDYSFLLGSPPAPVEQIQRLPPAALAYLGDAVYELYIRRHYLLPAKRLQAYHQQVVDQVKAEGQASHLRALEPHLTQTELEIVRRGRNAVSSKPRRIAPEIYQQASSLETLLGYLYLTDPKRLRQLLTQLNLSDPQDGR